MVAFPLRVSLSRMSRKRWSSTKSWSSTARKHTPNGVSGGRIILILNGYNKISHSGL